MPQRPRVYVLLLRALGALITVVVFVGFAFSDRVAGWLPHTPTFVVVFAFVVMALLVWAEVLAGRWADEWRVYAGALKRLASWLRRD